MVRVGVLFLLIGFCSMVVAQGEGGLQGKTITMIEFYGSVSDTIVEEIQYNLEGEQINLPQNVISAISVDSLEHSDTTVVIKYCWQGGEVSYLKEFHGDKESVILGLEGLDTIYHLVYRYDEKGFLLEVEKQSYFDRLKYYVNGQFSVEEFKEVVARVLEEEDVLKDRDVVRVINRRTLVGINTKNPKNKSVIVLNKRLQPKKVLRFEWNDYHQTLFKSTYIYGYKSGKLVRVKLIDHYGDIEMLKKIEYRYQ